MSSHQQITAIILSGGQGSRVNDKDKGLIQFQGKPMIEHVIEAIKPQVDSIVISANRNIEEYACFNFPVINDNTLTFEGPIAGIISAYEHIEDESQLILSASCDSPHLPSDYVKKLYSCLTESTADIAVVDDGERIQNSHFLMRIEVLPSLHDYFTSGGRSLYGWHENQNMVKVDFSDQKDSFFNINTFDDLALLDNSTG